MRNEANPPQPAAQWPVITLTVAGAFARLIPHPPNFTPVGGMSLFAGARMAGWQAYLLPLALMLATDPLLAAIYGFSAFSKLTPVVYASFLLNVWIGRRFCKPDAGPVRIATLTLICSTKFFLMTNFAVWIFGSGMLYPHDLAGLIKCYTFALPFFGRTLAGDFLYGGLLFSLHLATRQYLLRTIRVRPQE